MLVSMNLKFCISKSQYFCPCNMWIYKQDKLLEEHVHFYKPDKSWNFLTLINKTFKTSTLHIFPLCRVCHISGWSMICMGASFKTYAWRSGFLWQITSCFTIKLYSNIVWNNRFRFFKFSTCTVGCVLSSAIYPIPGSAVFRPVGLCVYDV